MIVFLPVPKIGEFDFDLERDLEWDFDLRVLLLPDPDFDRDLERDLERDLDRDLDLIPDPDLRRLFGDFERDFDLDLPLPANLVDPPLETIYLPPPVFDIP